MHLAVINHGKQYAANLNALSVSAKMQPRSGHAKTKEIFRSAQALRRAGLFASAAQCAALLECAAGRYQHAAQLRRPAP